MKALFVMLCISFATSLYADVIHMRCDVDVKVTYPVGSLKSNIDRKDTVTLTITGDKDGITMDGRTSVKNTNLNLFASSIGGDVYNTVNASSNSNITIYMSPKNNDHGHSNVRMSINRVSGELDYAEFSRAKDIKVIGACKVVNALF